MSRRRTLRTLHDPRWETLVSSVRGLAFWGSVLLPLVYLALLSTPVVVSGSLGEQELLAVGGLIVLNVLCLLLGHEHSP